MEELKGAITAGVSFMSELTVQDIQRAVNAAAEAGVEAFQQLWAVLEASVAEAIAAGKAMAPFVKAAANELSAKGREFAVAASLAAVEASKNASAQMLSALNEAKELGAFTRTRGCGFQPLFVAPMHPKLQ